MIKKLQNFFKNIHWVYSNFPNTPITGVFSVAKFIYWVINKRFRKFFIGTYQHMSFLYDTSSGECGAVFSNVYIEYDLYSFILFWIKSDSTVIDIGANIGNYSLLAASRGAQVHSFEPNRKISRVEKVSVLLNGYEDRVFIHNMVVSNSNQEMTFYVKDDSLVSSLLLDKENPGKELTVKSTTLDDFVAKQGFKSISLIKIDVEGAEAMVLAGATQTLSSGIVDVFFWETNKQAPKKERIETIRLLKDNGYEHFAIEFRNPRIIFRKWKYGDSNCISVRKDLIRKVKRFSDPRS